MKKIHTITVFLLTLSLLLNNVSTVLAVPPLPSSFYGTVKVNGENVPVGTIVSAWVNGVKYVQASSIMYEGASVYSFNVPGDDVSTPGVIEGGVEGDTIVFRIGDLVAAPTAVWHGGTNTGHAISAMQNGAPVITQGNSVDVTMSEDGLPMAFSLTLNATDANGDPLTWSIATPALHGTATASGSGTSKAIGYTPTANYNGSDSFAVRVSDGSLTDTIIVNVSIQAVNDAPVITEGTSTAVTMSEDGTPTAFNLTLHAADADGETPTWSVTTAAQHGTASASGSGTSKTIGYAPNANYVGSDSFVVTASDASGGSDAITVNVTIQALNDAPVITEGDSVNVTMSEDGSPTAFSLTLHATDLDTGSTLTWSIATAAQHGTASATGTGPSKAIAYAPELNYAGADTFIVRVSDGSSTDTIRVNVTVQAVNDAPVITEGASTTVTMSKNGSPNAFNLTLHAMDPDTGSTLTWSVSMAAQHGSASASGSGTAKVIGYTPTTDYVGSDSFVIKVTDENGATDTITVNVNIQAGNISPVITEGASTTVTMSEDGSPTAFSLTLHASDADGDSLTWSIATTAQHGTATASGSGTTKAIAYTPTANYNGSDSFVVRVSDGSGGTDSITVNVTIQAVNDVPTITEGASTTVTMDKDGDPRPFNLTLHATDSDLGSTLSWSISTAAQHGTASVSGTGTSKVVNYTPAANYVGTDSFVVTVSDGSGGTDTIIVNVIINGVVEYDIFIPIVVKGG